MSVILTGFVQQKCSSDKQSNIEKSIAGIAECAAKGAQLVVLQELHCGIYFCQAEETAMFNLAEPIPGPDTEVFAAAAKKYGVVLVSSLFEKRAPGIYHNTSVVFEKDGSIAGKYRKMHIPDDPAYYEKFYFTPGDIGFKTFPTKKGKIGTLICWDQWFPEAARLTAMQGASVIFYPTAIGWHPAEKAQFGEEQWNKWQTVQRGHAVANNVFVAAPNRIGLEEHGDKGALEFFGHSFICDTSGRFVAEAGDSKECILTAVVDPAAVEKQRQYWPYFRDRRIEHYGALTQHPSEEH